MRAFIGTNLFRIAGHRVYGGLSWHLGGLAMRAKKMHQGTNYVLAILRGLTFGAVMLLLLWALLQGRR